MQAGREIKFQAFDQETKRLWTWEDIVEAESAMFITLLDILQQDQFLKRQYTGLYDKSGKEIYEGDIIACTSELSNVFGRTGKMSTTLYEIFWKRDGWWKRTLKSDTLVVGKESDGVAITAKYSEVIGNIYENPDLLEVGK